MYVNQEIGKQVFDTIMNGGIWQGEVKMFKHDGAILTILLRAYAIKDQAGRVVGLVGLHTDITERKRAEEELQKSNETLRAKLDEIQSLQETLREQTIRDPQTGLFNRRYLYETMERELARAKREKYPVSVMMIDIDHFKDFNDTYGHQAGDEVLVALGHLLQNKIRQGDIACRYGGEEFIVIMPRADNGDTERRAEAIRCDFNDLHIRYDNVELTATISVGVAYYPKHGKDVNEIIKTADTAMYKAKQAGRNRVYVWKNAE